MVGAVIMFCAATAWLAVGAGLLIAGSSMLRDCRGGVLGHAFPVVWCTFCAAVYVGATTFVVGGMLGL